MGKTGHLSYCFDEQKRAHWTGRVATTVLCTAREPTLQQNSGGRAKIAIFVLCYDLTSLFLDLLLGMCEMRLPDPDPAPAPCRVAGNATTSRRVMNLGNYYNQNRSLRPVRMYCFPIYGLGLGLGLMSFGTLYVSLP
jgi:hypothetical protein